MEEPMTKRVVELSDHRRMDRKHRYTIPAGTRVEIRNSKQGSELRQHVTRRPLHFEDRANTGYEGRIFYFLYQDWVIAVNADLVEFFQ